MYTTRLTAALSGATPRQLAYWRLDSGRGPLLLPEFGTSPRALYSFRDVIALRICVRLRKETSLQRVRRSVAHLQDTAPESHLASHNLKSAGRTIVWLTEDGDYIDTVEHPGHPGIPVVMEEVFKSFTTVDGRRVPDLHTPAEGLSIDDEVRGGYPVVAGTRIPYDTVASLAEDGLGDAEIIDLYPSVTPAGIHGAIELSRSGCRGCAPVGMKVLLDEDVPQPVIRLVEHLLRGHEVRHVSQLEWSGKKDVPLISDAARRGFDAFVTLNIGQFNDPAECDAIKRSGMHHISYELPSAGLRGLGLASGALCAAIIPVIADLETQAKQQIVKITPLDKNRKRYKVTDPAIDPPSPYWR